MKPYSENESPANWSDIICSVAEYCEDCDTFHLYHLWQYLHEDGTTSYTVCDADGNHDDAEPEDVEQMLRDEHQSWVHYSDWVLKNGGNDPLSQFIVPKHKDVVRNVACSFGAWIGAGEHGMSLDHVKIGKRDVQNWRNLPKQLLDFLELKKVGDRMTAPWARTFEDAKEYLLNSDCVGCIGRLGSRDGSKPFYIKVRAEWREPRSSESIKKDVIRMARKHIKTHTAKA